MTTPIQGNGLQSFVSTLERSTQRPVEAGATERTGGVDFGERVEQLLEDVNHHQVNAEQAATAYANGDRNDMHGTMIAIGLAPLARPTARAAPGDPICRAISP